MYGVEEPRIKKWKREEYYQMADVGIFDGNHVELIEGEIFEVSPQLNRHAQSITLVSEALRPFFGDGYWIRPQLSLALGSESEPEPDVAVVKGSVREHTDHPTTALLVVEVSETTLAFDRREKASLYAKAGIPDYWLLNLTRRQLELRRNPQEDPTMPYGFGYAELSTLTEKDTVSPLAAPHASIRVADLRP